MRLKTAGVEAGRDPSQVSVAIKAKDGVHYLVLNKHSLDGRNTVEIGKPIKHRSADDAFLVELPEETDDGALRVWVSSSDVVEQALEAAE